MVSTMVEEYLKDRKSVWSPTTYKATRSRLKLYTGQQPKSFYNSLVSLGYNRYYIKTVFINISNLMDWSALQGSGIHNSYKVFMNQCPQLFRNVYEDKYTSLTMKEFMEEYNAATGEFKDILALLGFAGCRLDELYNFDGHTVLGKGGKRRRVYLPVSIAHKSFTLSKSSIRRSLKYNPHSYRKLAADTWLRGGFDIKSVQTLLGHASITATQRYLRPMKEEELGNKLRALYENEV